MTAKKIPLPITFNSLSDRKDAVSQSVRVLHGKAMKHDHRETCPLRAVFSSREDGSKKMEGRSENP